MDSSRFEIYQMDIADPRRVRALPVPGITPHAVDYDNTTGDLYWSDVQRQTIWKGNIFDAQIRPVEVFKISKSGKWLCLLPGTMPP